MKKQVSLYKNLWVKDHRIRRARERSEEDLILDKLIFQVDMCEDLESYVETLCRGMYEGLSSEKIKIAISNHTDLKLKVERLGQDIRERSHDDSDLYYLSLFAELKIMDDWLNKKVYQLLSSLYRKVLNMGLRISEPLRFKLKAKWEEFKNKEIVNYSYTCAEYKRSS